MDNPSDSPPVSGVPVIHVQTYVIVVKSPKGASWVVGTDGKRGFTRAGAERAQSRLEARLPHGWSCEEQEITPISEVLAIKR